MTATINASTTAGVVTTADTSGILQLQTNGTAALTVDASQNVGIGTASPSSKLHVVSSSGENKIISEATAASQQASLSLIVQAATPGQTVIYMGKTGATTNGQLGYDPNTDAMTMFTNNTERMRIDSSGNVGIGTTTPNISAQTSAVRVLTLQGPTTWSGVEAGTSAGDGADVLLGFYGFTFPANSTNYKLPAYITAFSEGATANQRGANMRFFTQANATAGATERARILSTGQVLIDRTTNTNSGKLEIYGDSDGAFNPLTLIQGAAGATSRNSIVFYRVSAGASVGTIQTTNTATTYNTSSDYRLKENITPMTGALAKVALLKPVTYKWKVDGSDGQGFIAHELDEVVSGCVTGEKDAVEEQQYEVTPAVKDEEGNTVTEAVMGTRTVPSYQGIDTSFLVATLTAAIQEQQALITQQAASLAALTTRSTALEERISALEAA